VLTGNSAGTNVFELGAGGDTVTAASRNDVFVFDKGDGQASVSNVSGGTLRLASDIAESDAILQVDATGDLTIKLVDTGESITFQNDLRQLGWGVASQLGQIAFGDGTTLDLNRSYENGDQPLSFTWFGTTADRVLTGTSFGANIFNLGIGGDAITAAFNQDTFVFGEGDGQATVTNVTGGTLRLASNIAASDAVLQADANGDLTVSLVATGDSITFRNDLRQYSWGVLSQLGQIVFGDGTRLQLSRSGENGDRPLNFTWLGGPTASALAGTSFGANTFILGPGGDTVVAGSSNDTFVFGKGDGAANVSNVSGGTLQLASGISASDVALQADTAGDLTVALSASGDSITFAHDLAQSTWGVSSRLGQIALADGTIMKLSRSYENGDHPLSFTLAGTPDNMTLVGTSFGANVFRLGPGGDTITAGSSNDTFLFDEGDGQATVSNVSGGTLELASDILASDVILQSDAGGDLIVKLADTGDSITFAADLAHQSWGVSSRVSEIVFGGGTALSLTRDYSAAAQPLTFTWIGTAAETTLTGTTFGANVFDLGPGGDAVMAASGNDSFVFDKGDGQAIVSNVTGGVLHLGSDIAASDVMLQSGGNGDLTLRLRDTGESITLQNDRAHQSFGTASALTRIVYGDGTSLDQGGMATELDTPVAADMSLTTVQNAAITRAFAVTEQNPADNVAYAIVTVPAKGSAVLNADGTFTYDPTGGFYGLAYGDTATTTFTYRATDSHGLSSAVKTVSITVVGNDHPPVASDVAVSTAPDQPVTHGFAATDPDVGDHLTYTVVSGPAQGSAAVNADGTFTYDPGHAFDALKPGQTAIASFTYKAIDQNGLSSAVQTVTVTVEGVDHPPTASNVSVTTPQNAPVTHAFAASDPDQGDTLTYAIVSGPTQGSVAVNADGSFTFDPGHAFDALTRGQTATVSFTYQATDQGGLSSGVATVTVTVDGIDHAPVASDVAVTTTPDVPVTHTFAATDPDSGDVLTYAIVAGPSQGSVAINANGTFTYDPGHAFDGLADGQSGSVTFTYEATDQSGLSSGVQTVTVTVAAETATVVGTAGNDTLYGTTGADIFDGKGGSDYEQGNGGSDTFIFKAGYGQLRINERDADPNSNSVLELGVGISPSQVSVTTDGNGNLFLNIGSNGDRVQLDAMLSDPNQGVRAVHFADGTVWTRQQVIAAEMVGTSGNDWIDGTTGADIFDGKGGNDFVRGNGGNDTFIFNAGYGQLRINEHDVNPYADNVLHLGAGITASSVAVTTDGNGSLILNIGSNGDRVLLDDMLWDPTYGVQAVDFADGTVWTRQQVIAKELTGSSGNDWIDGTSGADTFDGKGGNDYERGNGGNDTFIFNAGYGQLRITEHDTSPYADNVLKLGTGISPAAVLVTTDGNGNLFLNIGTNGDRVLLDGMLTDPTYGVQAVDFADGTVWTRQQVIAKEMAGTSGNDWIDGTSGADVIDGKGGNDYERGDGGNDTFIFNAGYGQLRINEHDPILLPTMSCNWGAASRRTRSLSATTATATSS
ncbi:MAG: tandem-95 repeat protein, partial [Methylobacteriaceae bacterium]|nr:tandem-95 repeat protein [Methylobacteriaceae bacterium]